MQELVAIAGTINAFVSLAIALRLYMTYRQSHSEAQGHFLLFYLYFGVFYLYFATSQLVLPRDSGLIIGIFHVISYFFLYLAIGYLMSFPLMIAGRNIASQRLLLLVFIFNIIFLTLRVIYFAPSQQEIINQYLYWRPIFPVWMRMVTGIFALVAGASASTLFLIQGWKQRGKNSSLCRRSLWLGAGTGMFIFASLLSFIAAPSGSFSFVALATLLVRVGLLSVARGVYYRVSEA